MRFGTLATDNGEVVVVISEDGQKYCEVSALARGFSGDMTDFIESGIKINGAALEDVPFKQLLGEKLLAPIPKPRRNIFCVGKNYHEHAKEFSQSGFDTSAPHGELAPSAPVVFTKAPTTVVADQDAILSFPHITSQVDYEAELAVVIGTPGRGIRKADALKHVWGFTILNDVTARDLQQKHRQWFLGKSMDTFCPMGPWIITSDEVDCANLEVRCWINNELRQEANTSDLIFDIPTIIETISAGMTLQPGDIIATGTPAGVGIGFKPPRYLRSGDLIKISIGKIGTLTNRVE